MNSSRTRKIAAITLLAACALLLAAVLARLQGCVLPAWIRWEERTWRDQIDGVDEAELLTLRSRRLRIDSADGAQVFSTPRNWQVSDAQVRDLDHDGTPELILLVWKQGSYGNARPFWIDQDSTDWSQHIFIYTWSEARVHPLWMSSDVGMEIRSWQIDADGTFLLTDENRTETVWRWQNWGLKLVDRTPSDDPGAGDPSAQSTLSLVAVGDNLLHPTICRDYLDRDEKRFDFTPLYARIAPWIRSHDLAFVGQETPLVSDPSMYSGFPEFGTPQAAGDALADAGFDVILGASNHALDKGLRGVRETCAFWADRHPEVTLLGLRDQPRDRAYTLLKKNGITLALFNATTLLNGHRPPEELPDCIDYLDLSDGAAMQTYCRKITEAASAADFTLCFLHTGTEYAETPDAETETLVTRLANAGADAVICAHPHIPQRDEMIATPRGSRALVCYSLGNFVADQDRPGTDRGAALRMCIKKDGASATAVLDSYEMIPLLCRRTDGRMQVTRAEDTELR